MARCPQQVPMREGRLWNQSQRETQPRLGMLGERTPHLSLHPLVFPSCLPGDQLASESGDRRVGRDGLRSPGSGHTGPAGLYLQSKHPTCLTGVRASVRACSLFCEGFPDPEESRGRGGLPCTVATCRHDRRDAF